MFNRILVPLDGSPLAERAIPHAMHFARIFGGSITLLQVLDPTPYRETITSVEPLNWQIRKTETDLYLKGIAERIRAQGVPAEHVLREGRPSENIVDFAQNENMELLVLTTHGSGGLTRWNISSVVSKVLEKAYIPVLVVRAYQLPKPKETLNTAAMESPPAVSETAANGAADGTGAVQSSLTSRLRVPDPRALAGVYIPATSATAVPVENSGRPEQPAQSTAPHPVDAPHRLDADIHYRRVLLPIDSSRRAECSLPSGIGIVEGERRLQEQASAPAENGSRETASAIAPASTLLLAAVIRPPELPIPAPYPEEVQKLNDQIMKISRESVNAYLGELQERIPVMAEKIIIENESVSCAIHDLVEKENVDLVVLCAHGMTGSGSWNWPYGSVARNYIEYGAQTALVIQDVPRAQIRRTAMEIAAEKYGSR